MRRQIAYPSDMQQQLIDSGFEEPTNRIIQLRIQTDPADRQAWDLAIWLKGCLWGPDWDARSTTLVTFSLALFKRHYGWSLEEIHRVCDPAMSVLLNLNLPIYFNL